MVTNPTIFWLSASHWEWVDLTGLILLLIGTAMELVADRSDWFRYFPNDKRRLETRALVLILLGLGLEVIASPLASYLNGLTLERERMARVKLEERLAWRRLSKEQDDALIAKLLPYRGQYVRLWLAPEDPEIGAFGVTLHNIMARAHWQVSFEINGLAAGTSYPCIGHSLTGIVIEPEDGSAARVNEAAEALSSGLRDASVAEQVRPGWKDADAQDRIRVTVCPRPL